MRTDKIPVLEKIFFENFFMDESSFELKNWKAYGTQSYNKIQYSIYKNVDNIINSVNTLTIEDYLKKKLTFLDFGVPDFLTLYQSNDISSEKIVDCVRHAIEAFEPRLLNVEVTFSEVSKKSVITIKGNIKTVERSFFEIAYHNLK